MQKLTCEWIERWSPLKYVEFFVQLKNYSPTWYLILFADILPDNCTVILALKGEKKTEESRIQPLICWVMYLSEASLLWKCVHRLCDDAQPLCPQARRGEKQRVASSTGHRLHRPVLHLHQKVNAAEQLHKESTHACVTGNAGVSVLLMSPVKMCIFICVTNGIC